MDYTHTLDELPIRIAGQQVAFVNGTADLSWDEGYKFFVREINVKLEGGGVLNLHEGSDDPEIVKAFRDISTELYDDDDAEEAFAKALAEYQLEAA